MTRDETVREAAGIGTLSSSKRAGQTRSTSEHWTCSPGAAAGLDFALPPDNAQLNAEHIELKSRKKNRTRLANSPSEPQLSAPLDREREHKTHNAEMNENRHFRATCGCTYSPAAGGACAC